MIKKILTLPLRVAKKLVGAVTGGGRERPAPSHSKPSTAPKSWTPPTPSKPAPRSDEDDRGHSHSHGHSHDHGHSHSHEPEPPAAPEPPKAAPTPEPPAPKPAPKKAAPKKAEPKAAPKKAEPKAAPKKAAAKKAAPKKAAPKKAAAKKATPKKAAPKKAAAKKPEAPAKHGDVKANGIDTPNPNAMKFELSKKCFAQPVSVATRDGADSDWTQAVFAVSGVRTLFAVNDFVTVTKEDNANWANMTGPITEALESNL